MWCRLESKVNAMGVYREGEPYMLTDANGQKFNAGIELTQVVEGLQYVAKMTSPHLN